MSEWDEYADGWDDDEAVRAYAGAAYDSLVSLVADVGFGLQGSAACDFGCGTGLLTERLAEPCDRVDAVDNSAGMRRVLVGKVDRHGWRHVRVLEQLPTDPQRYDLIVCSSVLSFVDDYPGTVAQLMRHLAPGGLFVQWDWAAEPGDEGPGGLASDTVHRCLIDAGFDDVAVMPAFEVSFGDDVMRPLMGTGRRPR